MIDFNSYPPRLCLNGTSFGELRRQKEELSSKLLDCLNALQEATPHARDWQLDKGFVNYTLAMAEHKLRLQVIERMLEAVNSEMESLEDQRIQQLEVKRGSSKS